MLVGRYEEAVDGYRLLVNDFRGLTGAVRVHEAAAIEMLALAMALIDGSKLEVGRALEKAVLVYVSSGRRELAVRTALRVVDYCFAPVFQRMLDPCWFEPLLQYFQVLMAVPRTSSYRTLLARF